MSTPETTKSPHFCEGFVLYGAAPGVELDINLLIYRDYFFCNVISISTDTLVMQNADAGTSGNSKVILDIWARQTVSLKLSG